MPVMPQSSVRSLLFSIIPLLACCVIGTGCARHATAQANASPQSVAPTTAQAEHAMPAAQASDSTAVKPAAPAARTPPVPLLWKVSDADNSLYLLGSFHLLKPDDVPFSADVDAAFADAESLLFEIDPADMQSGDAATYMARTAMREDGTRLNDVLPKATADKLDKWLQERGSGMLAMGMNGTVLQMFDAWYVGLLVTLQEMMAHGLDPEHGMDQVIAGQAGSAKKATAGLETVQDQIRFLDGMDHDEQIQMLDEALTMSTNTAGLDKLHGAWRDGDAERLWKEMALDMKRAYPQLYQRVNVDRNDNWVPKLDALLKAPGTDDTLVVVGALHLLGEDGVVEKLRARGYRVERICSACATGKR